MDGERGMEVKEEMREVKRCAEESASKGRAFCLGGPSLKGLKQQNQAHLLWDAGNEMGQDSQDSHLFIVDVVVATRRHHSSERVLYDTYNSIRSCNWTWAN